MVDIREQDLAYPDCGAKKYARDGWYHGKHGKRHKCTVCKRRFGNNPGFEYRQVPRPYITPAPMLPGMAAVSHRMTLKHLGIVVHVDTTTRILEHHPGVVGKYAQTLKPPCTGDKRGCEKMQKVRGRESYMAAVMDLATRFIPAWDISSPEAVKLTGHKVPRIHASVFTPWLMSRQLYNLYQLWLKARSMPAGRPMRRPPS